jgi:hypothetical protein
MRHAVIAFPFGSMPELIEPGINGALVESVDQAVAAVEALPALDPTSCRRSFEERFTTARMARDYVRIYEALARERVLSPGRAALPAAGIPITVPLPMASEERPIPPPLAAEERQPLGSMEKLARDPLS